MSHINREVQYTVSPFAVAIANYLLFGRIIGNEETEVKAAITHIDGTGNWWVLESVAHHPAFEAAQTAFTESDDINIDIACQSFAALFLGSVGGVFGLAQKHAHITETAHATYIDKARETGRTVGPQFRVGESDDTYDGLKFGYVTADGVCPGCGETHTDDLDELIKNVKDRFGSDAKITQVEAKVDEDGNITNLDQIPEELHETLTEVVRKIHAERQANLH